MSTAPQPDWQTDDGSIRLYCADWADVVGGLSGIDCVTTDPPYGINADRGQSARADKRHGKALAPSKRYEGGEWDSRPLNSGECDRIRSIAPQTVIFGGNYFPLPPSRCWLVWDKLNGDNDYADCELAWTNADKPVRRISFRWHGMLRDEPGERVHPTQKPVAVMAWSMEQVGAGLTILDPFMGSGTTGIACIRNGSKVHRHRERPETFPDRPRPNQARVSAGEACFMTMTLRSADIAKILESWALTWAKPGQEISVIFDRDSEGVYARVTVEPSEGDLV